MKLKVGHDHLESVMFITTEEYIYVLYMSIYWRLIAIGKYMEGKFIAGKSLGFIGGKINYKNTTIMTI